MFPSSRHEPRHSSLSSKRAASRPSRTGRSSFLRERNWSVERPHDWETPRELCTRLDINIQTWVRRTKYRQCPSFETIRGKLGRRSFVRSTPQLEKFLTNGKR